MYDRTDAPKPDALERESWWSSTPVVHIARRVAPTPLAPTDPGYEADQYRPRQTVFPDWSPINREHHDEKVEIYSNCEEVELFLNEQSLGVKFRNPDDSPRIWSVGFVPGTLRAIGRNKHVVAASETLRTAGSPAKLTLLVERAKLSSSWDDVAYLRAEITDKDGTIVPNATNLIHFSVTGPGRILATDNGDNADRSGFQKPDRAAYKGAAIVIIRATRETGAVTVRVDAEGLYPATKTLQITPLQ
jgi:beta-galactosidase